MIDDFATRQPDLMVHFDGVPSTPRQMRRSVAPLLNGEDDPIAAAVLLVTSELVSNVVLHATGGGTLRAWDPKPDTPFRLEVIDNDLRLPAIVQDPRTIGGRGLRLVDELADAWGALVHGATKVVWAEFDRSLGTTT